MTDPSPTRPGSDVAEPAVAGADNARSRKLPPMLLWGFGPLIFTALLIVLVALMSPSVAPEHYVPMTTTTDLLAEDEP